MPYFNLFIGYNFTLWFFFWVCGFLAFKFPMITTTTALIYYAHLLFKHDVDDAQSADRV